MKTPTQGGRIKEPRKVLVLTERWILSGTMWILASLLERRLIKAIKRTA